MATIYLSLVRFSEPLILASGGVSGATISALGALVAALAAFVVGLFNYRNQARQLAIAREGQLTDRFTRAIEQLGNDKADVRLGGIYALEQIANASSRDRRAIVEVLTAFVQGHAPWPPSRSAQPAQQSDVNDLNPLRAWAPDVQAAMTVLGRRVSEPTDEALDLTDVDLRRAELPNGDLQRTKLHRCGLQRIVLHKADLQGAELPRVQMQGADLTDAKLGGARVRRADLRRADFGGADLRNADLEFSDFRGAILGGADLRGANVTEARFEGAEMTPKTNWPEGFAPKGARCHRPAAAGVSLNTGEPSGRLQSSARLLSSRCRLVADDCVGDIEIARVGPDRRRGGLSQSPSTRAACGVPRRAPTPEDGYEDDGDRSVNQLSDLPRRELWASGDGRRSL